MGRQTLYFTVAHVRAFENKDYVFKNSHETRRIWGRLAATVVANSGKSIRFSYVNWKVYWFTQGSPNPLLVAVVVVVVVAVNDYEDADDDADDADDADDVDDDADDRADDDDEGEEDEEAAEEGEEGGHAQRKI